MKKYYNIITFFMLILLSGCKEKIKGTDNVISINPKEAQKINVSEFVESISYIKLETSKNCIMGKLSRIIIKEKYIYAIDKQQKIVFVFDKKGRFVSKLDKKGKGPDEYIRLGEVFVSDKEDYIEIFDALGKKSRLIKYSNIDFKFIEAKAFNNPFSNSCIRDGDIYYFSAQQIENTVKNNSTNADIIVAKNGKIIKPLFEKKIVNNGFTFSPFTESFTKNNKGEIFVSLMYNNTFFQLSNMIASPLLTVDFGMYGIDNSIGLKKTREQMKYLDNSTEGLASFPVLNANNSRILTFSYYYKENAKNKLYQYLKFKNSNKTYHIKEIINNVSDFPKTIYISSYFTSLKHEIMYKNYLVDILIPTNHLDENEVEIDDLGKISIQDNPIIMLMKLKDNL